MPGRDPKAPILLVGGHLDSWDLGTGAIDDGAGVAITTAAAKRIMDAGRPLRTIRVVWFGAEEPGGFGGTAYAKAHGKEPLCHRRRKRFRRGPHLALQHASSTTTDPAAYAQLAAALAPLGIAKNDKGDADGTDVEPTIDGRRAVDLAEPGRHPLFRLSTTRPTTRSTRSTRCSCGRMSRRGRRCSRYCRAELSRSRNSRKRR